MSIGYTIEGFNLHQPDLGYTLLESTAYAPEISPNRVNLRVPNYHGQIPLWNDELTETKLAFKVRLRDDDALGLQAKWEHLRSLMWTGSNQGLTVRRVISNGTAEQITSTFAQLETMNQPDFWCAAGMIDVVFILNAPSGRWQSIQTFDYTFPNANPQAVPFVSESTAPNTNVLIRIGGPVTTTGGWVEVTDLTSRTGVQIFPNRTTTAGQFVLVDMETRRVWLNSTDSFLDREQEITASVTLRTVLGGNLSLVPIPSFNPADRSSSVKLRRSTGAASVSVALRGRRTYI